MLRPQVVKDLELKRFGYDPIPLDPPFATFAADGTPILFHNDEAKARESLARVSPQGRGDHARVRGDDGARRRRPAPDDAQARRRRWAPSTRATCSSCCARPAAPPGSRAARPAGALPRDDDVGRRPARRLVRQRRAQGRVRVSTGVVGVWAGPRTPGTAYNLLHHELGELDGVGGAWGHVRGGMGAITESIAASARAFGATIRTGAAVTSIDVARRPRHRRHARRRRDDQRPDRAVRRAPEDDGPRPRRRRALPRGGRHRHGALPQPRRLREGQLDPVRAAALQRSAARPHEPRHLPEHRLPRARLAGRDARQARRAARTSRSRCRRRSTRR